MQNTKPTALTMCQRASQSNLRRKAFKHFSLTLSIPSPNVLKLPLTPPNAFPFPSPPPTTTTTTISNPSMDAQTTCKLLLFVSVFVHMFKLSICCTFTISNNCPHTIWPGTLAGAGTPQLPTTGFRLDSGQTVRIPAPPGWSGRIWARTGCEFDGDEAGMCQTGDCGGRMECHGVGALPPATLFEITLGKGTDQDFYDVSLVDGYNLPLVAIPGLQNGECNATGCMADLNRGCPKELQVDCGDGVIACKSACEVFGLDQYCCSGEFANPNTCKPSLYSSIFKSACPRAYSFAFDDATSTFTCKANDYNIVFCPTTNWMKRSDGTSVGQPINGHSNGGEPGKMTSTASGRAFHSWFLLLFILFF